MRELADGRLTVMTDSNEDTGGFLSETDAAGDLHLTPAQLLPLVPERLDPRLFNISALYRDGYGSTGGAATGGLPLLVTYVDEPVTVLGLVVQRPLASIKGSAATLDPADVGRLARDLTTGAPGASLAGVKKIWLDGKVAASLDESVPQIGAPAAWAQGYDGTGLTIAVVDSGIDDMHPDLAGRVVASKLFAQAPSTTDVYGHGTHVASIAAGSGAASDGRYTGVAYGADLVNAKVLQDDGFGYESSVIAGMEWATVEQHADIVNVSVNGLESDGTDLMSQAVDALSEEEGALFVVSAGDLADYDESVKSPATAVDALAVGAVNKSDVRWVLSPAGPVINGTGVKPEVVAPGVEITAARAKDAQIGVPVGERYLELTGTYLPGQQLH